MTIIPVNPALAMSQSIFDGIRATDKPVSTADTRHAFIEMLLDKVFLYSFMKEEEGIFKVEDDSVFNSTAAVGIQRDLARNQMIKQLAENDIYGFSKLFSGVPGMSEHNT